MSVHPKDAGGIVIGVRGCVWLMARVMKNSLRMDGRVCGSFIYKSDDVYSANFICTNEPSGIQAYWERMEDVQVRGATDKPITCLECLAKAP
jgi:hypothetical protein